MGEWNLPDTVQKASIEKLGGSFSWETGVYDASISMVYLNQSASEAVSFNVVLKNSQGKELEEAFWIKSGKAKGNKTFYTKNGKDFPLPGYSVANSLCVAATGQSLAKNMDNIEQKTIQIYDSAEGKKISKERPVLVALLTLQVKVAVQQILEFKQKKNDATGEYENIGETRTVNECKFFGNSAGKTTEEILSDSPAGMFEKWSEKYAGQVLDKTLGKKATASAAKVMGGSTPVAAPAASSLFAK